MARSYANSFSQDLKKTESYVDAIHSIVISTFDTEAFSSEDGYIDDYISELDGLFINFAHNNNGATGMYITFNPELTESPYELWYEDVTGEGPLLKVTTELIKEHSSDYFKLIEEYPSEDYFLDPDNEGMRYLYQTIQENRPIWFDPYKEIGLDIKIISYVVPVQIDDMVIGVIGMDIDFDNIVKTIQEMDVYKNGYAFLMNSDFKIMVHPDSSVMISIEDFKGGVFSFLKNSIAKNDYGVVDYSGRIFEEKVSYSKLSNGWTLVLVPSHTEIFKPVLSLSFFIIILTIGSIIASILIAFLFSNRISKTIDSARQNS